MPRHQQLLPSTSAAAAQQRIWFNAPLLALLILALAVLAAGCGAGDSDGDRLHSADAVHETWVEALREGNSDAALAITDPELPQREQFARDEVSRMRDYITSPASPTGALESVSVEPVSNGVGRSVWQFAQKRWCYRADLVSRGEGWFISRWGQTSVDCT
jgi:hypothetical protein